LAIGNQEEKIDAWFSELPEKRRRKLYTPGGIIKAFDASKNPNPVKPKSRVAEYKEKIIELEDENAALKRDAAIKTQASAKPLATFRRKIPESRSWRRIAGLAESCKAGHKWLDGGAWR